MPRFVKGNRAFANAKGQGKSTLLTDLPERYAREFLNAIDKRVRVAKVLGGILNAIYADLGGKENVSVMQQMLCEKIGYLKLMTAKTELTMARGGRIDEAAYLNAVNTLSGLLSKIGLKRRAKQISLKDYLNAQPAPQPTEPQPGASPQPTNKENANGNPSTDHSGTER